MNAATIIAVLSTTAMNTPRNDMEHLWNRYRAVGRKPLPLWTPDPRAVRASRLLTLSRRSRQAKCLGSGSELASGMSG